MATKPTITNLKTKNAKQQERPLSRTKLSKKPVNSGLASGLTKKAIKVFQLAKQQQQEQAVTE